MKLLLIAAAALAVASCASFSLEDLEFHAWKLKYGEKEETIIRFIRFLLLWYFVKYSRCAVVYKDIVCKAYIWTEMCAHYQTFKCLK